MQGLCNHLRSYEGEEIFFENYLLFLIAKLIKNLNSLRGQGQGHGHDHGHGHGHVQGQGQSHGQGHIERKMFRSFQIRHKKLGLPFKKSNLTSFNLQGHV